MSGIIDFHTHAFTDSLAAKAMAALEGNASIKAFLDGRISSLLASMDRSGIDRSVVCSIATKPSQFRPMLEWSLAVRSDRIIPLLSVHPSDRDYAERIRISKAEGFKGIKMHPYYQDFFMDEDRMLRIYEAVCRENLLLVMHTGYDVAFEKVCRADPAAIIRVVERFPELKLVTTHLGGWEQWREVNSLLAGRPVYMEISFSLDYLETDFPIRDIFMKHPKEYILFGTDSPWTDQEETLSLFRGLGLGPDAEALALSGNAERLLESV
jgi:predicted TIM-barrel fold metal-dependent hydrolase